MAAVDQAPVAGSVVTKVPSVPSKRGTTSTQRLKQDYLRIMKDPVPYVTAHPLPSNILEWHYVVKGPEGTPYEGGIYHGKLSFPSEFPFKPPAIYMLTPNGRLVVLTVSLVSSLLPTSRFKTNMRLCLSISDYHPDSWNPAWSVSTILTGLLSFMIEKNPTMGSIETSEYEKKVLAKKSLDFNLNNKVFVELFPDIVNEINERKKRFAEEEKRRSVSGVVSDLSNTIRSHGIRAGRRDHDLPLNENNDDAGAFGSLISNVVVVVVFAAFIYTVRYVLLTISQEGNSI